MSEMGAASPVCPHCGYDAAKEDRLPEALRRYTILRGKYLIGKVLAAGRFGMVYSGFDLLMETRVVIQEWFPSEICTRRKETGNQVVCDSSCWERMQQGLIKFLRLGKSMIRQNTILGVNSVLDVFEENGTAYAITQYLEGVALTEFLRDSGPLKPDAAIRMLMPLMETLEEMHSQQMLHQGIAPNTVLVRPDGELLLLRFDVAHWQLPDDTFGQECPESTTSTRQQDVQALCRLLYACINGQTENTQEMLTTGASQLDLLFSGQYVLKTVGELIRYLQAAYPDQEGSADWSKKRRRIAKAVLVTVSVIVVMAAVMVWLGTVWIQSRETEEISEPDSVEVSQEVSEPEDAEEDSGSGSLPFLISNPESENTLLPSLSGQGIPFQTEERTVAYLGCDNADMAVGCGYLIREYAYEYFVDINGNLCVCPYDEEDKCFYLDNYTIADEQVTALTMGEQFIYYVNTEGDMNWIMQANFDGTDPVLLFAAESIRQLQYVTLSDGSNWLYFITRQRSDEAAGVLQRYSLDHMGISGSISDVCQYAVQADGIYLNTLNEETGYIWSGASLDLQTVVVINDTDQLSGGYYNDEYCFMFSEAEERVLIYNCDGERVKHPVNTYTYLLYNHDAFLEENWFYYYHASRNQLVRISLDSADYEIVLSDCIIDQMNCERGWLWMIARIDGAEQQHAYLVYQDGDKVLEIN